MPQQDDALLRFLESRSRADFELLVRGERALLLAVARRLCHESGLAEDAVQEVFVRLIEVPPRVGALHSGRGYLVTQVIGAARRLLRGEARRSRREQAASRAEAVLDEPCEAEAAAVRAAVFELPDALRQCVELRYFGGLSSDEIGRTLGCARRSVDERLEAARETLRRRLTPPAFALASLGIERDSAPDLADVPREFAERLERLFDHPGLVTASATATATAYGWWLSGVAAACLAVAGVATWAIAGARPRSTASLGPRSAAAAAPVVPATPTAQREAAPATGDERAPRGGSLVVARAVPSTADLRIHVVDAAGTHVTAGELRLEPASFSANAAVLSLMWRADLARFEELLAPIPLAGRNPFEVGGLPSELLRNAFEVYAVVPGFGTPEPGTFVLGDGLLSELTLVLPPLRSVAISVEDAATRLPIAGATVVSVTELERRDTEVAVALRERSIGAATSDGIGAARLEELGAGEHEIEVHAAGYRSARAVLDASAAGLAIALDPLREGASLIVDVLDPGNMPIDGARVILRQVGREAELRATTDGWGRCRFGDLEPGSWSVELDALPYAELRVRNRWQGEDECTYTSFELAAGDVRRVQLGFLLGTAAWVIQVVDARGQPCPGVEVNASGPSLRTATTRADGRVLFERLPAGEWTFELDGWRSRPRTLAEDGMRTDRAERGGARIHGRVTLADTGAPAAGATVIASGAMVALVGCDEEGRFELRNAPPGTLDVVAAAVGYANAETVVDVTVGAVPPIELALVR